MGIRHYKSLSQVYCVGDFASEINTVVPASYTVLEVDKNHLKFIDTVLMKTKSYRVHIEITDNNLVLDLRKYNFIRDLSIRGKNLSYVKSLPLFLTSLTLRYSHIKKISNVSVRLDIRHCIINYIDINNTQEIKLYKNKGKILINTGEIIDIEVDNKYLKYIL